MKEKRYIHITNWFSGGPRGNGFQRFKDRKPNWIRLYFDLAKNDDYRELTGHRRAVLIGLWMEYGMKVRRDADDEFTIARGLLDDTSMISRDLNLRVTRSDLESLNHAGFIYFSEHKSVTTSDGSGIVEAQIPRGLEGLEGDKTLRAVPDPWDVTNGPGTENLKNEEGTHAGHSPGRLRAAQENANGSHPTPSPSDGPLGDAVRAQLARAATTASKADVR